MKRHNAFRMNVDRTFLQDTTDVLTKVITDFDESGRWSPEIIDEVIEIRDTLVEMLDEHDEGDDF